MLTDIVGKELKPGDLIAYPRRSGSCTWMTTARILEIREREPDYYYESRRYRIKARKNNGRLVMVDRVDNVVKIEEPTNDQCD